MGTSTFADKVAKVPVNDPTIFALIGTYVVKMTDKAVSQASMPDVSAIPTFSPPLGSESSSSKCKKYCRKASWKASKKARHRRKSTRASSAAGTWFLAQSWKGGDVSRHRVEVVEKEYVLELPILHVTNSNFQNVVHYQTYRIANKFQRYNGKLVALIGKHVKGMESTMKPCRFDGRDPATILCFSDQFKRACDSNEVLEKITLWTLPSFMKEGPHSGFNDILVPIGASRHTYARPKKDNDNSRTYAEAVEPWLKSDATNANIFEATSKIGQLVGLANEPTVQFADTFRLKAVKCGNAYLDERIKKVLIDGLQLTFCSGAWIFGVVKWKLI